MNRPDDEFDDFLTRRKHVFRGIEDPLEPPDELDRLVLHQAREALEGERPQKMYKGPRFVAPIAIAATLVLAVTVLLNVGMPANPEPIPEVTVQTVAQRLDYPAREVAAAAPAPHKAERAEAARPAESARITADNSSSPVVVDRDTDAGRSSAPGGFVSEAEAGRYARIPPSAPSAPVVIEDPVTGARTVITDVSPPPTEAEQAIARARQSPTFRGDSKRWLAEIERLRAEGKGAQADAEFAEYKRQHRAYAVSPDR
jgi:hypothetical protein